MYLQMQSIHPAPSFECSERVNLTGPPDNGDELVFGTGNLMLFGDGNSLNAEGKSFSEYLPAPESRYRFNESGI